MAPIFKSRDLKHAHWAARIVAILLGVLGLARSASPIYAAAPGLDEQPLVAPQQHAGSTLFVVLPPDTTGVRTENSYSDPKMWGSLYQEFLFGAVGTGVAIGDYDNDGRPDIFVVSKTESCRLFRNLGGYKFEDVTEKAGVADRGAAAEIWKNGVTFADVNNDGLLDIYVCRFNAPNLLYINQGDGTFKEMAHAYGLDVVDASGMASFCDYDRDGWLDVYIATNILNNAVHPRGQRGYLFHNNRNGTFSNVTDAAGIAGESQSHSATWWDYNNDGWPDLYVANDYGVPDKLYRNNHDGTFTDVIDAVVPHTSFASMGADEGDVNNDGLIDFFVADMLPTTHEKDQRSSADIRGRSPEVPDSVTGGVKLRRNALLLNTGLGRCLEAACLAGLPATDWTWSPRWEDLDNDGRLDLFVTNGMMVEQNIDVNTRMMLAESTAERIQIMHTSPPLREKHLAFRNRGNLQFENVSAAWGLDQEGISFGSAFGDLNGDGNLDVVYANYQAGATLMRNDCAQGHRIMVGLRGTASNRFGIGSLVRVETARGTQVRQLWLARGYMSSSEPALHFGLGDETTIRRLTVTWPSGRVQTFENLPADRRFTITEPAAPEAEGTRSAAPATPPRAQFTEVSQNIGVALSSREEPVNEVAQQRLLPMRLNRRGPALAVSDINGDGIDDIIVAGTTITPLELLLGAESKLYRPMDTSAVLPAGPVNDGPVLLFDIDASGKPALLVSKGGSSLPAGSVEYQSRLYQQDAAGGYRTAAEGALPTAPISAGALSAADFDHDGRLDVFIGGRVLPGDYPTPAGSAIWLNRGGKFEDVTDQVAPALREVGLVTSALWTDVDGDGWVDLVLTLEWGTVKYFHNQQGRALEDWSEQAGFAAAGKGWWNSIAAADFNGDGRMDYVVGNVGLNTPYQADSKHPVVLYSGEFKGEGTTQLVEGYYEGDRLYPRRSRRDLGAAIPSVLKKYPTNNTYARATLNEMLGDEKLAAAQRYEATELRSGVFLSQPDGSYHFEPLPRIAQISPIYGVVAADFDGDGQADIYAVQNSFAPVPSVGRFDGGLSQLLVGDGHGHFAPVPVAQSGLVVPGDAKALAMVDFDRDGWPDFLVSRNGGTLLAFRNGGAAPRHSLRVQLRGPAGNPTGIGARVIVASRRGAKQTAEVYAGSGYYSQSTPSCFFGYSDTDPIVNVTVRWPTGETSEQVVTGNPTFLVVTQP